MSIIQNKWCQVKQKKMYACLMYHHLVQIWLMVDNKTKQRTKKPDQSWKAKACLTLNDFLSNEDRITSNQGP